MEPIGCPETSVRKYYCSLRSSPGKRSSQQQTRRTVRLESRCALTNGVRKVAVHSQKMLEVMSTGVYTGLNPFNCIRKHILQIWFRKVAVHGSSSCDNLRNDFDGLHSLTTYRSLSAQGLAERTVYWCYTVEMTTIKTEFHALRFSPRCNRESRLLGRGAVRRQIEVRCTRELVSPWRLDPPGASSIQSVSPKTERLCAVFKEQRKMKL
jgi:hypothetical protein